MEECGVTVMGEADCETESTFKRKEGRSQEKNDVLRKMEKKTCGGE